MIAGVLLAAGAGRRYGRPKILVPGWLDSSVRVLRDGGCTSVVVVTGAARPQVPAGAREAHCPRWERGMGASLRTGLEAVAPESRAVVVHLVDLPDVDAAIVGRVIHAGRDGIARAVFGGRPGHPVVLARRHLPELLAGLDDAAGAADFLRSRSDLIEVECADLATGQDRDVPAGEG